MSGLINLAGKKGTLKTVFLYTSKKQWETKIKNTNYVT